MNDEGQWRTPDYMLTKHVDENPRDLERRRSKPGRSGRVIMTNEARVLRELRIRSGLSMREVGKRLGCSDSYISHIENGRSDVPKGEKLDQLLAVYGGIKQKSFFERVRKTKEDRTPQKEINEIVERLTDKQLQAVLGFIKGMLNDI